MAKKKDKLFEFKAELVGSTLWLSPIEIVILGDNITSNQYAWLYQYYPSYFEYANEPIVEPIVEESIPNVEPVND